MTTARAYAEQLVRATTLEGKLVPPPPDLALDDAGPPLRIAAPGRPAALQIVPVKRGVVPPVVGMHDPAQRARLLHALANHELQAIELFAWALLAYPAAPAPYRRGLVALLAGEQRPIALYAATHAAHTTT